MTVTYNLAPIPIWQFTNDNGQYNVYGNLHTYRDTNRQEEKICYQDIGGTIPYPNPIILDGIGSVGPIYWASDENYFLVLKDPTDTQVIWTVEHFNAPNNGGSPGPITTEVDYDNLIEDGQFNARFIDIVENFTANTDIEVATRWYFQKSNTTATDKIQFLKLDQSDSEALEGNPIWYFHHECTVAGTGESEKRLTKRFEDVRTLANKEVILSFVGKSSSNSTVELVLLQDFGSDGSGLVYTIIGSQILTPTWTKYSVSFTVPTTVGKIIGSNTSFNLICRAPLNATMQYDITNVQLNLGNKILEFQYCIPEKAQASAIIQTIPTFFPLSTSPKPASYKNKYLKVNNIDPRANTGLNGISTSWEYPVPIGASLIWPFSLSVIPDGFVLCNGQGVYEWACPEYVKLCVEQGNPYGVYAAGNLYTSNLSGDTATINNSANGACEHMANVSTAFTFTILQNGDASHNEIRKIKFTDASLIAHGSYFNFGMPSGNTYSVYYLKDGNTFYVSSGRSPILIYISSSDTASDVAAKTCSAGLGQLFALVPDYRGFFIRGLDYPYTGRDPDAASRTGGNVVGSTQADQIRSHTHSYSSPIASDHGVNTNGSEPFLAYTVPENVSNTGGNETRGLNIATNFIIKVS
jgi:hypothetical protein